MATERQYQFVCDRCLTVGEASSGRTQAVHHAPRCVRCGSQHPGLMLAVDGSEVNTVRSLRDWTMGDAHPLAGIKLSPGYSLDMLMSGLARINELSPYKASPPVPNTDVYHDLGDRTELTVSEDKSLALGHGLDWEDGATVFLSAEQGKELYKILHTLFGE